MEERWALHFQRPTLRAYVSTALDSPLHLGARGQGDLVLLVQRRIEAANLANPDPHKQDISRATAHQRGGKSEVRDTRDVLDRR